MGPTEVLANFVLDTRFEELPGSAIAICKKHCMDNIASTLAAVTDPTGELIQEFVRDMGGGPEATVLGHGMRTSLPNAAFANAALAHASCFDDTSPNHPSVTVVPPLLAIGEKYKCSGKELVTAQVIGYDVFLRMHQATNKAAAMREAGWHPTGFFGSIAGAAVASKLLRLNVQEIRKAFGIAASLSGGLSHNIGTMTMALHAGNAARNGVTAALLAQRGYTADEEILEGRFGFMNALCGIQGYNEEALTADLGKPFKLISPGINIKFWPSCWGNHRAVDAMLYLVKTHNLRADDVKSIECDLEPEDPTSRYLAPKNEWEARYSIGYCIAVALLDGCLGLEQFDRAKVSHPKTLEVLNKVKHVPQKWTKSGPEPHWVKVCLKDGTEYTHGIALRKGDNSGNPLTREEMLAKYRYCAERVLSKDKVERSIEIIDHLDAMANLDELIRTLTR